MKSIDQPHDAVFKSSLNCITVARNFFEVHLPKNILILIDLQTLRLCSENFISNDLQKYNSDLIYKVYFKNNNNDFSGLYLLIEHESTVNPIMLIRVHNYLNLIIQKHLKQHKSIKKLPLTFAIIYYTGQKPYSKLFNFFNKFSDVDLAKQLFNVPHKLVALNQFTNQEIIEQHKVINLLEFVQKNIYIKDFFVHNNELSKLLKETNILEYKQTILKYLSRAANISDKQEFFKQLKIYAQELGVNGGKFMGTLAEYWFEDGMQKGIEKGIEKGMQKGKRELARTIAQKMLKAKVELKTISKFTGLKLADLENLVSAE